MPINPHRSLRPISFLLGNSRYHSQEPGVNTRGRLKNSLFTQLGFKTLGRLQNSG